MWSMVGITVLMLGVLREKKRVADEPHLIVPTGIRLFSDFTMTYDAGILTRVTGISTYQRLKYRGQTYRNPAHPAPNSEGPFG